MLFRSWMGVTFKNIRIVAENIVPQWTSIDSIVKTCGPIIFGGQHYSQYRLYWHHAFSGRRHGWASSSLANCFNCNFSRRFYFVPRCYMNAHYAPVYWKRLSQMHSHDNIVLKIAQAISLALSRSPGIFALLCGELALAKKASADSDPFSSKNTMYMHAEDGHAYMMSLFFSVLECFILLLRALYLAILFSPCIAIAPFADCFGPKFRKTWLQLLHHTLERAGPALIKWGQWAATRPDLFPRDLCTQLSELHTRAPQHSFAYTRKSIERAFGRNIFELFDNFEEVPIASGSIAQVHRASLKCDYSRQKGKKPTVVAVKVRHPGVGESIRRDFAIINTVAKITNLIPALNWLRLDESVRQFAIFMMSQVDLAREAAHLSRFIYNFRSWKHVSFPKPLYPLVHPAVLVESFEQGECVSHYMDVLQGHNRIKTAVAHIGTHALLKMLLVDNFIHADLHPGNVLVRAVQSKSSQKKLFRSKPHIIFIDVGMTAELSGSDRVNLLEFFKAVARRDGRIAAESILSLSRQQNCPNPKGFIEDVESSFKFWATPEGDLIPPSDCMQHLLEQVRRHRVNVDGNVCTVIVTTLVLEGWQRKLDPSYNVMDTLRKMLLKSDWAESLSYTIEGLMAP